MKYLFRLAALVWLIFIYFIAIRGIGRTVPASTFEKLDAIEVMLAFAVTLMFGILAGWEVRKKSE